MPTPEEIEAAKLKLLNGRKEIEYESPAGRRRLQLQDADKQLQVIAQLEADASTAPNTHLMSHRGRGFRR